MDPIGQNAFKQKLAGSNISGATSIELASISNTNGNEDYLPDPTNGEYNVIFFNTLYGNPADARNNSAYMIGRVTSIDYGTNTLTITTAQENTSDVAMDTDWACLYGPTAKWFTDVANKIDKTAYSVAVSDEDSDLDTGTGVVTFRMPYAMSLTEVRASVGTAPTGSALTVDINEGGSSILSTKLTIDAGEKTSTTAATAAEISDADLADDAEITIDIDAVGSTVAGAGLKVTLIGTRA